jgi:DNA-binding GntR family transcriptional regulator
MSTSGAKRLAHQSMADEVAAELRRLVLSGAFEHGERITQDKLAKTFGVSTMPVREALLRLAAEGLIVADANRSFSVVQNTADDLRDVYWIYGKIAGELAYRAAQIITGPTIVKLTELHAKHEAASTPRQRLDATWSFHRTLHQTAGSRRLLHVLTSTLQFFPDMLELPGAIALETSFQSSMLEDLRAHDPDSARATAERFAARAAQIYITYRFDASQGEHQSSESQLTGSSPSPSE